MTAAATTNGKPRKQLSEELDRLDALMDRQDRILDALAEGLNGAVAEATKEASRLALKDAIVEILTSPDLRVALNAATAPPAPARGSAWARLKAAARRAADKARQVAAAAVAVAAAAVGRAVQTARTLPRRAVAAGRAVAAAWRWKKAAALAVGAGTLVATVAANSHAAATALSAAGAIVATIAVQAGLWVRRLARRVGVV